MSARMPCAENGDSTEHILLGFDGAGSLEGMLEYNHARFFDLLDSRQVLVKSHVVNKLSRSYAVSE